MQYTTDLIHKQKQLIYAFFLWKENSQNVKLHCLRHTDYFSFYFYS